MEIRVDAYNLAGHRVYSGVSSGKVFQLNGTFEIDGLNNWAPGIYLLRVRAALEDGTIQRFPVTKLMVK